MLLGELLGGLRFELLPTLTVPLKIPRIDRVLNPETLERVGVLPGGFDALPRYHPTLLFGDSYLPDAIRQRVSGAGCERRTRPPAPRLDKHWMVAKAELEVGTLVNGMTNSIYLRLVSVYFEAGYSETEAFEGFQRCLSRSPWYTGDLWSASVLLRRIQSSYRNLSRIAGRSTPKPLPELEVGWLNCIEETCRLQPLGRRREPALRRILEAIIRTKLMYDPRKADLRAMALPDCIYPYYRKNLTAGYYSLPKVRFTAACSRYYTMLKHLQMAGKLRRSPYPYVPATRISKYYQIQLARLYRHGGTVKPSGNLSVKICRAPG